MPNFLISHGAKSIALALLCLAFLAVLSTPFITNNQALKAAPFPMEADEESNKAQIESCRIEAGLSLELIENALPARPRTIGYEYNQKNHQAEPDFIERDKPLSLPKRGQQYRVIALRLNNSSDEAKELNFRFVDGLAGPSKKNWKLKCPPKAQSRRYFAIKNPADLKLLLELKPSDGEKFRHSFDLSKSSALISSYEEALGIANELTNEDLQRLKFKSLPFAISVKDDLNYTVADAKLLLLQLDGWMLYQVRTDQEGKWSGHIIPGEYELYVFAEVPDRTVRTGITVSEKAQRVIVTRTRFNATDGQLEIKPTRKIELNLSNQIGASLPIDQIWVTPAPLLQAYKFAEVAAKIGNNARLQSIRRVRNGKILILSTEEVPLRVCIRSSLAGIGEVFLNKNLPAKAESVSFTFEPAKLGRFVIDPLTGVGPGEFAKLGFHCADGAREHFSLTAYALEVFYVQAGTYRTSLDYRLCTLDSLPLAAKSFNIAAGQTIDLTPRAPFHLKLYYKNKPGDKKVQYYLGIQDVTGRILTGIPDGLNQLLSFYKNKLHQEKTIGSLRWEEHATSSRKDPNHMNFIAQLQLGFDKHRFPLKAKTPRVYNAEGASITAPDSFEQNAQALLPEMKKAMDGSWRFLGLPKGGRHLHLEFDFFLPPGVGGTGGGGRITLDFMNLLQILSQGDALPGAFRHELGHNLGFGHDPYMLLAPSGVDEERYGEFGYRLLHGDSFEATYEYLNRERYQDSPNWSPGAGIFASLRLLYGADVHKNMLIERGISEKTMELHQLSSIERIATLYSLVVEENVAWIFRANGWPVFDHRVEQGAQAVRYLKKHPRQIVLDNVKGFPIHSFWMYGPEPNFEAEKDSYDWRPINWPTQFVRVDEDRAPQNHKQQYLLARRIYSPEDIKAQLVCASDVQLEIKLNGMAIAFFDSSPQFSQPVHDEIMLEQKRAIPVQLLKGENLLEIAVTQPPGSKGFLLEFIDFNGDPISLGLPRKGPGDLKKKKLTQLLWRDPVYNGSFEDRSNDPDQQDESKEPLLGWLPGANEPNGAVNSSISSYATDGKSSLLLSLGKAGRGGVIQRIVMEPGKTYELSVDMRSEGLDGEAYVAFFTQDLHQNQRSKTPILRKSTGKKWRKFKCKYTPYKARVVYVACYLKGKAGSVWFDNIRMIEK